jgi:M6 family metalloprotease-like protein
MHATTRTHRQERRGSGPYRPRALFVYTAFVLAAVLALAPGASPNSPAQPRPSDGASALAPPRLRPGHGRGVWARRHRTVPTEKPLTQRPTDPSPPACSPSLFAAPYTDMNEGTTNSTLPLRPGGRISAVMLFVDFADHHASESTSRLYSRLVPRSRAWFAEVSYGRLHLSVTAAQHWLRMPRRLSAYGLADGIGWPEHRAYMADAIAAADSEVDFSRFQVVYVVAAKGTKIERSPAFQAYPGSGIEVDGSEVRYGATFFDDTRADARYAANVLSHETGHILGLPDLYDVDDVPDPTYWRLFRFAGGWDMMSWNEPGAHFLAWEKWKLGWLDPSELTCLNGPGSLTTTITPLERAGGLKAVVVLTGSSSAYVVEARRRIGQDARLCKEGVLVYAVDATVHSGYGPVRVRPAERDSSTDLRDRCGPLYNAPFAIGHGRVARFEDASAGLSVKVLASGPSGYRVRVTRASLVP